MARMASTFFLIEPVFTGQVVAAIKLTEMGMYTQLALLRMLAIPKHSLILIPFGVLVDMVMRPLKNACPQAVQQQAPKASSRLFNSCQTTSCLHFITVWA